MAQPLRISRIAGALFLVLVSLWALLLPPIFPFSSHAIVNAKAVTIRATVEGVIGGLPAVRSQSLNAGDGVARISRDMIRVRREIEEKQLRRLKLKERLENMDTTIVARQTKLQSERVEVGLASAGAARALEQSRIAAAESAAR